MIIIMTIGKLRGMHNVVWCVLRVIIAKSEHLCRKCKRKIEVGKLCVQSQENFSYFWHAECKNDPKRKLVNTVRKEKQIERTEGKTKTRSLLRWVE